MIWIERSANRLGISRADLEGLVKAQLKEKEKVEREAKAEERRIEQRAERSKEKKAKEKTKALAGISKLPRDQRDTKLVGLAKSLDEDVDALQEELVDLVTTESSISPISEWDVEAWSEPVVTAVLLQALIHKINKHAVMRPHEALAIALWIMFTWVHEVAARYSPYLVATVPDADCGKTTLIIKLLEGLHRDHSPVASRPRLPSSASPTRTHQRCYLTMSTRSLRVSQTSLRFSRSATRVA